LIIVHLSKSYQRVATFLPSYFLYDLLAFRARPTVVDRFQRSPRRFLEAAFSLLASSPTDHCTIHIPYAILNAADSIATTEFIDAALSRYARQYDVHPF
jgi:hypothetical protein